jgi:hypothetical protein
MNRQMACTAHRFGFCEYRSRWSDPPFQAFSQPAVGLIIPAIDRFQTLLTAADSGAGLGNATVSHIDSDS